MATAAEIRHSYRHPAMAERMRVARSRGALSGLLLVLLGLWGGLVPFIGPYFGYAYTPDSAWTYTMGRLWLEILPAVAVVIGGLLLLLSTQRAFALAGAVLALAGGAWFVVGPSLSQLWHGGTSAAGMPSSTSTLGSVAEQIGFFYGLGAVILIFAGVALGRMSLVGLRDLRAIDENRRAADELAAMRAEPEPRTVVVHDVPEGRTDDGARLDRPAVHEERGATDDGVDDTAATAGERADDEPPIGQHHRPE